MSKKEFDWWDRNVTSEIYLNTNRRDWWKACLRIAEEFKGISSMVDIGGGDGHTLWQILSCVQKHKFKSLLFLEPSKIGIKNANHRLSGCGFTKQIFKVGILENNFKYLKDLYSKERADILYLGHVNYYFGNNAKNEQYEKTLEFLPSITKKMLIMTAPSSSDYYKILKKSPFGEKVFSEYVYSFYLKKGYRVKRVRMPIRFFVKHIFVSELEAAMLYKFFNDTQNEPSNSELNDFKTRVKLIMDKNGEINFKDELLIVEGKE
jgi:hypothetical protein